ncbi:hypothetical protein E8E11_007973 [Didymella keratinophila]|nr:hypothetical protein E8E11_007973 [Didymella keratinophila]
MARDYMPALLVLSGDRDREGARTKLLESIGKDALVEVVNSCLKLGVSKEKTTSAKPTQTTPAPRKSLLAREGSIQEDDNEDFSFIKNDIDTHTPFINPANKTQAEAGKDLATAPVKKNVPTAKGKVALAQAAIGESPKVLIVRKKRMRHSDGEDTDTMMAPKRKALPRKRDKCDDQSVSSTVAVPKTKIKPQGRAKPRARAAPKTFSSL